jgi:hypothetical protein
LATERNRRWREATVAKHEIGELDQLFFVRLCRSAGRLETLHKG